MRYDRTKKMIYVAYKLGLPLVFLSVFMVLTSSLSASTLEPSATKAAKENTKGDIRITKKIAVKNQDKTKDLSSSSSSSTQKSPQKKLPQKSSDITIKKDSNDDNLYTKSYIGNQITYRAKYEDTFVHLARDYNLGFVELRAANPGIDPWIPGENTKLILPTRHILPDVKKEGVVINLPEMRVYAFVNGSEEPFSYPLGVGREGLETPMGKTKVVAKAANPSWRPTMRMRKEDPSLPEVVEPGPDNPLGSHALYLGWPQYAIHGTNRPFGIGRRVSSGCIRLYPEAIKKFYNAVAVGTKVQVVDQPIKLGWIQKQLYIEAHPDMDQAVEMEEFGVVKEYKLRDQDMAQILKIAGKHQNRIDWAKVRKAVKERKGYPIRIARAPSYNARYASQDSLQSQEEQKEGLEALSEQDIKAIEKKLLHDKNTTKEGEKALKEIMESSEGSDIKRNQAKKTASASSHYSASQGHQEAQRRTRMLNP